MLDDLRPGFRQIIRNPGFTLAAVLTLALGVGATTAVFTLADPMLFRPLPYPDANRLYVVAVTGKDVIGGMMQIPDAIRLEEDHLSLAGVANANGPIQARTSGSALRLGYRITAGFLSTFGVQPILGRAFHADEYRPGDASADVALITFELWQSEYGGRVDILDQSFDVAGGRRHRIVGVLPKGFVFPDRLNQAPSFLTPTALDPGAVGPNSLALPFARLAPGVTPEQAISSVQSVLASIEREHPDYPQGRRPRLIPLRQALFGPVRTPLLMLLGATGCVLLLASANLAHLFMSRLRARRRELGVRLAMGSGPWRLARLLFVEALLVAIAGGALALVLGQWIFDLVISQTPRFSHVYRLLPSGLDWRVGAFAAVLAAAATIVFAAGPLVRASRTDIRESLQDVEGKARRRLPLDALLISTQSGVAVLLLITSGLIVGSFMRLAFQPIGYEPERVQTAFLQLDGGRLDAAAMREHFRVSREIYERLRSVTPGGVTLAGAMPGLTLDGLVQRADARDDAPGVSSYGGTGSFFRVMGIRLLRGRVLDEGEAFSNAPVAVLDERAADAFWPGEDALGKLVRSEDGTVRTVVGVARRVLPRLNDDEPAPGSAFVPFPSDPRPPQIVFRTDGSGPSLEQVRETAQAVAPGSSLQVFPFEPFERRLGQPRFLAAILGALGLLTITLTVVGIFGVVNHAVARRTREMGIRAALGADSARLRRMVMRRATTAGAIGVVVGSAAALWWTSSLRALLHGFQPNDVSTFALSGLFVVLLVAAAALTPAWRASRVAPVVALRAD